MAKLPPDVHDWLGAAAAARHPRTMNDMLVKALVFYMHLPEDTIDNDGSGLRACCYTSPTAGHRGTCRYSSMRGGPDSSEYQALKRGWQQKEAQS